MSSWKGVVLIIISLALAAGAGGVVYYYLQGMPVSSAEAEARTTPVVVASSDLTFGTRLESTHLKVVEWPRESLPSGSKSDPDSVLGQTTKVFVVAGEPILASKLSSIGGGLSVRIPEHMRASSVTVNDVSGVSGFILPGDRVDVLATIDNLDKDRNAVTKTILQNVEVLAAGVKTQSQGKNPIQVQSVTVQVDPAGAERLALGMHEGKIHLVLRNPADHEVVDIKPTNTKEVMGLASSKPKPRRVYRPAPKKKEPEPVPAPPPVEVEDSGYTVIRNGEVKKEDFPTEAPKDKPKASTKQE